MDTEKNGLVADEGTALEDKQLDKVVGGAGSSSGRPTCEVCGSPMLWHQSAKDWLCEKCMAWAFQ